MKKIALLALTFSLAAGLLAGAAWSYSGFPFNGGFERVDTSQPAGWDLTGTWLLDTRDPAEGKKFCYLPSTVSRDGDQMVSQGYRLVQPGDTVVLNASYQSSTGGAVVGLMLCDSLGRILFPRPAEALPAATSWTPVQRRFVLDPANCPRNLGAVRVLLGVAAGGQAASFDAVSLTVEGAVATPSPARPASVDVLNRPNLLANPNLAVTAATAAPGWSAVDMPGTAATQPVWLSDPVAVDLSLPYTVSAQLPDGTPADGFRLLARISDPQDPSSVWLQIAAGGPTGGAQVHLARLARESETGLVQVAIAPIPRVTSPENLTLALRPEPVSLSVHGVAMCTDFATCKEATLFITAVNNTDEALAPTAHLKITDATGTQVSYEPRAVKIGPHSAAYFPYHPNLTRPGTYTLMVHLLDHGRDYGTATFVFQVLHD